MDPEGFFAVTGRSNRLPIQEGLMAPITPEIRQAIEQSGGAPARVEDPETHKVYVLLDEETYRRLCEPKDIDRSDLSLQEFEDFQPIG
jgi:hypothetical protein